MHRFLQIIFLLLITFGISSCKEPAPTKNISKNGFIYCVPSTLKKLNPQLANGDITTDTLAKQLFNSLLNFDPTSLKPTAAIATNWVISKDGLVYDFTLKENIKFHTTPWFTPTRSLNADDVVFSFNRFLDKTSPFYKSANGNFPWLQAMGLDTLIEKVKKIDNLHVRFKLKRADNNFLANIASNYGVILSKEYAMQCLSANKIQRFDLFPIGTGPFKLAKFKYGSSIKLLRHENYWQKLPKLKTVFINTSPFGANQLSKLLSGDCDVMAIANTSQLPEIQDNNNLTINSQEAMNVVYLSINTQNRWLKNVKLRQAIALAINRQHLIDAVYYKTATKARNLISSLSWANLPNFLNKAAYRPILAKQLVKEIKLPPNKIFKLWYISQVRPYNPNPKKMAEIIQANLNLIGIKTKLQAKNLASINELTKENKHDLIITGAIASTAEPENFMRPLLSCSAIKTGVNFSNWCHPTFEYLLERAALSSNKDEQLKSYYALQRLIQREVPIIPLVHGLQFSAHNNNIKGIHIGPFGTNSFTEVFRSN